MVNIQDPSEPTKKLLQFSKSPIFKNGAWNGFKKEYKILTKFGFYIEGKYSKILKEIKTLEDAFRNCPFWQDLAYKKIINIEKWITY